MEIEDVLEPGERLLWEGRPAGYRISRRMIVFYVAFVLFMLALPASIVILSVKGYASRTIDVGFWGLTVTGASVPPGQTPATSGIRMTTSVHMPGPLLYLGFIVVAILANELWRVAVWRAWRYGITDRRVLATNGKKLKGAIPRADVARVAVEGNALVVEGSRDKLRFEDLVDPKAARSALEQAPLRPPAPEDA